MNLEPIIKHSVVNIGIFCHDTCLARYLATFWLSLEECDRSGIKGIAFDDDLTVTGKCCTFDDTKSSYHKIFWIDAKPIQVNLHIITGDNNENLHMIVYAYNSDSIIHEKIIKDTLVEQTVLIFSETDIVDVSLDIPYIFIQNDEMLKITLDEITYRALEKSIKLSNYYCALDESVSSDESGRECMFCTIA